MNRNARIFVAGGQTLFGAALKRRLRELHYDSLIEAAEPDPLFPAAVEEHFCEHRPEIVFVAAGLSGGIGFNQRMPATLMHDNLLTVCHLLDAAQRHKVQRLLYLGSACMYPSDADQPLAVHTLGSGRLEPTSAPYATARYAGMVLCDAYRREQGCDFRVAIPANGYGPEDDFSTETGHVIPALIKRFHEAKQANTPEICMWGSGEAIRDFIHADDVADACLFLMQQNEQTEPMNIGSGFGIRIKELAETLAEIVGYRGLLSWDKSKPDGQLRKVLDSSRLQSRGWQPTRNLRTGLEQTYNWYRHHGIKETTRDAHSIIP